MTQLARVGHGRLDGPDYWTPLVERLLPLLTRQVPEWAVLKNHAQLPVVTGDIDLCLPRSRWDAFLDAYLSALEGFGSFAVVVCDHYLDARFTFALPLDGQPGRVLQVDLMDGLTWKGARLLSAAEILADYRWDARGFRRVTTGLEAAVQLTCNAVGRGGNLRHDVVRTKGVQAKALADADAFHRAMVAMHGRMGGSAAGRFVADEWRCPIGLLLVGRRMLLTRPRMLARASRFVRRKAMAHYRGFPRDVPGAPAAWHRQVSRGHRVYVVGPEPAWLVAGGGSR
jgi:hypothetical protein